MSDNKNSIFKVQQQIAFIISIAGLFVVIVNIANEMSQNTFSNTIILPHIYVVFILTIVVFITAFLKATFFRLVQIGVLFFSGSIAIMDDFNSIYGLGLVILALFLAFKYDYLKKYFRVKVIVITTLVFSLIEISARINNAFGKWLYSLNSILYLFLFLVISYIIYQDDIKAYIIKNKDAEDTISKIERQKDNLTKNMTSLKKKMEDLDAQLDELTAPVDLDEMGITPAEKRVLEVLVLYGGTDKSIAEHLYLSYHTVKNHFRKIRDKLGVDRRDEIIEMCRNNFKEEKVD